MAITKEAFFREHLIPAGQLFEILLEIRWNNLLQKERTELSNLGFDMLNLAACYAAHPRIKDVSKLEGVIRDFTSEILKLFESMGPNATIHIVEAFGITNPDRFGHLHRTSSADHRRKFTENLRSFLTSTLPLLRTGIHLAIGYDPSKRQEWIATIVDSSLPLTKGGRLNRWRTFVRNTSWDRAATMAGIRGTLATNKRLEANCFNTHAGREQVDALWAATFDAKNVDAERNDGLKALPVGVHITSTPDRLLQVSRKFDPMSLLNAEQVTQLKAQVEKGPKATNNLGDLGELLKTKSFVRITDAIGLAAAVVESERWETEQHAIKDTITSMLDDFQVRQRKEAIRAKLASSFSSEDRELLLSILAEEDKLKK